MERLPIGNDNFSEIRQKGQYFVDKSLFVQDFIETEDKVALIARPRRFGKTLNLTMLRDFFDISKDSRPFFEGLAIMETPYGSQINTKPVVFLSLKNCRARTAGELVETIKREIYREYLRNVNLIHVEERLGRYEAEDFYRMFDNLRNPEIPSVRIEPAIWLLLYVLKEYYGIAPILLIDEYDQPIMSCYEYGYQEELEPFFSNLYGSAMKGNDSLGQALLTGVQRVAKESIFSQFNNPQVYTVLSRRYALYFGFTAQEAGKLLESFGLRLDDSVRGMYDGYQIGGMGLYNPWSILNYADSGFLGNYWINTSANILIRQALKTASRNFWKDFDILAAGGEADVWLTLDTSYAERDNDYTLWGLLVNAGYLTVPKRLNAQAATVRIPNGEVLLEFQSIVSELSGINGQSLEQMFGCLLRKDMGRFLEIYRETVLACTSYMDAKENAYHMLFLGMCISLRGIYKVTSNLEAGHGRSDISLESKSPKYPNVIIEFKQGHDLDKLKEAALRQIIENEYYAGFSGEVVCVGLAHDKKHCSMAYKNLFIG